MPVALVPEVWAPWLDRDVTSPDEVLALINPIEPDLWMEHEVSSRVNSVKNNGPDLLDPPAPVTLF
jgi:putative SOS response-associated peptidase YedK